MSGGDPSVNVTPDDVAARTELMTGAQVVLDPASDAALAAQGAQGGDVHANTVTRDLALMGMGLVPRDPHGDVLDPTLMEKLAQTYAANPPT